MSACRAGWLERKGPLEDSGSRSLLTLWARKDESDSRAVHAQHREYMDLVEEVWVRKQASKGLQLAMMIHQRPSMLLVRRPPFCGVKSWRAL